MTQFTAILVGSSLLDARGDFNEYEYELSIVETSLVGSPEEASNTHSLAPRVKISRTLQSIWKLDDDEAGKVCFEYIKRHLQKEGLPAAKAASIEIDLNSSTAPSQCPFDPDRTELSVGSAFEITVARPFGFKKP